MYNISKGQLWVVITGAVLFWLVCIVAVLDDYSPAWWKVTGAVLIPFLLIFYVIGWKRHHKQSVGGAELSANVSRLKRPAIRLVIVLILGAVVLNVGVLLYQKLYAEPARKTAEAEEYVGRINRFQQHVLNAQQCREEFVAERIEERTSECQTRYDRAYSNYKTCRAFDDHKYCLLNWPSSNYEAIDCSEEATAREIETMDFLCYRTANEELLKIKSFEEALVDDYIKTLPPSQSSLNSDELRELYSTFPQSVFNEKTEQRIKDYLSEEGYLTEN